MYLASKLRLKLVSIRLAPYYVPIAADLVFPRYLLRTSILLPRYTRERHRTKKNEEERERESEMGILAGN